MTTYGLNLGGIEHVNGAPVDQTLGQAAVVEKGQIAMIDTPNYGTAKINDDAKQDNAHTAGILNMTPGAGRTV